MELAAANGGDMAMPISVGGYGHMTAIHEANAKFSVDDNGTASEEIRPHEQSLKKTVRYRECLKNHAASIGGHANDGCGEFMPSGSEGTLEALKCAACNCHRNFHRREVNGEPPCYYCLDMSARKRANAVLPLGLPSSTLSRSHPQMIMAMNSHGGLIRDNSEEQDHLGSTVYLPVMKKRFRTKFTQEQKDRMYAFAEQLGWRIQKHDDVAVQQFCMDVGVKRHVLKVWMHNNKHTLAKKL